MKKTFILLIVLILSILLPCLSSARISVNLKLDRREATPMDSIRMTINLSGSRKSSSNPVIKGLESFSVTSGGTSSRVEIINGKINSGVDYTYFLQPREPGTYTIGPAEVTVKGKIYLSNTEILRVIKPKPSAGEGRGPIFLTASLSSPQAYLEEQIVYSLKLYRLVKVSDVSLGLPKIDHITFKQLGNPLEYRSIHNDQSYQVLEVRYALIPSREGVYAIDPATMNMTAFQPRGRSSRGMFDDPFFSFSSGRPITLSSDPLELTVIPLPKKGSPDNFSGLVGTFQMDFQLAPSEIKAGESATLTVILKGRGNVSRMPDLKLPEMNRIKVYADEPVLKNESGYEGLAATKTMKWALVPEKEGKYRIPRLSISYFDTENRQYQVIKTSSLSLSVLPGEKKPVEILVDRGGEKGPEATAKQAVKELGRDILPIHTFIKDLTAGSRFKTGGIGSWIILLVPFLLYLAAFGGLKIGKKSEKSLTALKSKKAAKNLIHQCRQKNISSNQNALLIRDYLNNRFALSLGSLTPQEAAPILLTNGVSPATAQKLRDILQNIEDLVYTGKKDDPRGKGEDLPGLIRQIEKEIR